MTNREPRTVRVDPETWSQFTSWVVEQEGQKHGEIGRHVENALEEYTDHGREARIEEKVDEVLTHLRDGAQTHTQSGAVRDTVMENDEPPHANARRQAKVAWLAAQYDDWQTVDRTEIRETVDGTYAYADEDRAEALVEAVISRLGLLPDPRNNDAAVYVTESKYEALRERFHGSSDEEVAADD